MRAARCSPLRAVAAAVASKTNCPRLAALAAVAIPGLAGPE
jgi:hypothetical protein